MPTPAVEEDAQPIGARLRSTRELAEKLTARELDRLAHRTEGHCNLIESRPHAKVNADTVADYAHVLGVSTDWLILGHGEAPTEESVRAAVEAARAQAKGDG